MYLFSRMKDGINRVKKRKILFDLRKRMEKVKDELERRFREGFKIEIVFRIREEEMGR